MRKLLYVAIGSALAFSAQAYDQIPQQDGVNGYVFFGASSSSMESNTLATIGGTDVSDQRIDSLSSSPDSKNYSKFSPAFEVSYTFAGSRTQVFGGTEMEDFLTQDGALGIGVRQGIGSLGNVRLSALASTSREVWEDPYVVNANRSKTDQKNGGVRLGWEHILQSNFDITYTKRKIELDDELSGSTLRFYCGRPSGSYINSCGKDIAMLGRNGDKKKLDVSYRWQPSAYHVLIPTLSSVSYDLDGKAVSMDGYLMGLSYTYLGVQNWEFIANGVAGSLQSDDYNPIYDHKQDLDRYGLSLAATYREPFGMKDWSARAAVSYGQEDSNIDFYDTSIKSVTVGMLYGF